jgi:ABC-2 type transport system permease protein
MNTAILVRLWLRRDRIMVPLWVYGLTALVASTAYGFKRALVQAPAVWVLAGIAAALFGLLPRFTGAAWGAVGLFLLLGQLGPVLNLSQWVMDVSPFTHVPKVPGGAVSATPLIWLAVTAAALAAMGLAAFRRRDLSL